MGSGYAFAEKEVIPQTLEAGNPASELGIPGLGGDAPLAKDAATGAAIPTDELGIPGLGGPNEEQAALEKAAEAKKAAEEKAALDKAAAEKEAAA